MIDFDRLRGIAEREVARYLRDFSIFDLEVFYRHVLTDLERAEVLRMIRTDARIPAPPRIIRTVEELQDLDPDTLMIDRDGEESYAYRMQASIRNLGTESMYHDSFPAVVIATGEQVRAAQQRIKEEA